MPFPLPRALLPVFVLLLQQSRPTTAASGDTTCADHTMDWYSQGIGETPYTVPTFNGTAPPEYCSENDREECCCNPVSFNLMMLCMSCQIGAANPGRIAGSGTYRKYFQGTRPAGHYCSPKSDTSPTVTVQATLCNNGIKIPNVLYGLLWTTEPGNPQNHEWASDDLELTSTYCNHSGNTSVSNAPAATNTVGAQETEAPASSSPGLSKGVIAAIVVIATFFGLSSLAFPIWLCLRSKRRAEASGPRDSFNEIHPFTFSHSQYPSNSQMPGMDQKNIETPPGTPGTPEVDQTTNRSLSTPLMRNVDAGPAPLLDDLPPPSYGEQILQPNRSSIH